MRFQLVFLCAAGLGLLPPLLPARPAEASGVGAVRAAGRTLVAKREQITKLKARRRKLAEELVDAMGKRIGEISRLQSERQRKIAELLAEKDRTRRELAAGEFCSKCRRCASQIERETGKSFDDHVELVDSEKVPMSVEEILERTQAYDKKIKNLAERLELQWMEKEDRMLGREERLKKEIRYANLRLTDLRWERHKAKSAFHDAVQGYQDGAARSDADWHAKWQLKLARLEGKSRMWELTASRRIVRAKARLTKAIADDEGEAAANAAERDLNELVINRRLSREHGAERRETLEARRAKDRNARETARAEEEHEVARIVRETTGRIYTPVGVRTDSEWTPSAAAPSPALAVERRKVFAALDRIRRRHHAVEDDDTVLDWASRAKGTYHAMRHAAARVRQRAREFAARRARIERNKVRRLHRWFDTIRDYIREDVLSEVPEAVAEEAVVKGWVNVRTRGVVKGTAQNWVIEESQHELMKEIRQEIRRKHGGDYWKIYDGTLGLDLIDPKAGAAAWYDPFKPDAIAIFFDRRIREPLERMGVLDKKNTER